MDRVNPHKALDRFFVLDSDITSCDAGDAIEPAGTKPITGPRRSTPDPVQWRDVGGFRPGTRPATHGRRAA